MSIPMSRLKMQSPTVYNQVWTNISPWSLLHHRDPSIPEEPFSHEGSILHTEEPFLFQRTVWVSQRTPFGPKNPRVPYERTLLGPKNPRVQYCTLRVLYRTPKNRFFKSVCVPKIKTPLGRVFVWTHFVLPTLKRHCTQTQLYKAEAVLIISEGPHQNKKYWWFSMSKRVSVAKTPKWPAKWCNFT